MEALKKRDRLLERKTGLIEELALVEKCLKMVSSAVNLNDRTERKWVIELPLDAFVQTADFKNFNWKKTAVDLITKYQVPMSSDLMYNKVIINFDAAPLSRRTVLQNISSSLHSLYKHDKILMREKDLKENAYIYGFREFFNEDGKLKTLFMKRYRMEKGENLIGEVVHGQKIILM